MKMFKYLKKKRWAKLINYGESQHRDGNYTKIAK